MTISELTAFQDREVVLQLKDGETLRARIMFVDLEYEDIIVDVVGTNQPEHYKNPIAVYVVAAPDILTVSLSS